MPRSRQYVTFQPHHQSRQMAELSGLTFQQVHVETLAIRNGSYQAEHKLYHQVKRTTDTPKTTKTVCKMLA